MWFNLDLIKLNGTGLGGDILSIKCHSSYVIISSFYIFISLH